MILLNYVGSIFVIGICSINPIDSIVSSPILTVKNCSYIELWTEVVFTESDDRLQVTFVASNGSRSALRFIGLRGLNVGEAPGDVFQQESNFSFSPSTLTRATDPFNVTLLFRLLPINSTYQFSFSIRLRNEAAISNAYGKSWCDPGDDASIVCENNCLCDTPIYRQCPNETIPVMCSDPGTLFQSPGILTFNETCSSEPKGGLTPGQTAGIVIGVLIFIILVGAAIYCLVFKKK